MPENPTKTGYEFDGWYLDEDVWSESFTANSLLDTPISSDMSVYAKFTAVEYTISYLNTKDVINNNPTVYNIETNTIVLMDLQKDGYEFLGWYIGNEKVDEIEKGSTGNITLIANWATTSYTATFYANNVKVGETKFTIEGITLNNIPFILSS